MDRDSLSPPSFPIGQRLRATRLAKGFTLEQVARRSGLDKSFISRLEREATEASVASLLRVCAALGIQPSSLFELPKVNLVRSAEAPCAHFGGEGVRDFILSRGLDGEILVLRTEVEPGGHGGKELYIFPADTDFVTVLEGSLEFTVGEERYVLYPGDSLTFCGQEPHTWRNPGSVRAVVLWVLSPAP
ncbi:MAG: cupin domain-containing protein [Meiothermus sp.]|uniref:helix-turn-helix domain-containing protein n=1 Tax=Meiothermus sp. TaxID=1955249 RepID=UPI0025F7FAAF|nr:cupin domain-containing protein [Meiothermus sp.]MCS7069351.1 cupin domain-containing protein [Meiothermus sp.]MDW8424429.1 cupin domain-containing protein [Meiothermus sp.]